jgi:hypothetical protein
MKTIRFTTNNHISREAVIADQIGSEASPRPQYTYTGYVTWDPPETDVPDCEEIDVTAASVAEARKLIEQELKDSYEGDWRIVVIEQRVGFYF